MRFIDNNDGTITDTTAKLMWQKSGSDNRMNWVDAHEYANQIADGGYTDWRLPTIHELFGLVDIDKAAPATDPIFESRSTYYWSSSTYVNYPDDAWVVNFGNGDVYYGYKSNPCFVALVRGG